MYVGNQYQQYWKFDVREEKPKLLWKFDAKVQGGGQSPHSVALLGTNLYLNTGRDSPNPRLIALDKNSGEVVFDVGTAVEGVANTGHSSAPLAVKDRILIGSTGRSESGRGFIAAYSADTDTMQELWSFETGTQFAGNPMAYSVNGKQYIALTLGGRPGRDEGSFPEAAAVGQNVMLMVFGL
jgi:outer membrane protein assembly factor BamB